MDRVYCEDFVSLGVDAIFQHAWPSMASSPSSAYSELVDVALLEILEAEIRPEETGRSVLQRDPPVALDGRRPQPLIRRAIGMVHDEQRDAFHFRWRRESENGFGTAVRSEPFERPSLVGNLALGVKHLQHAFIALCRALAAALRLHDDLSRVRLPRAGHGARPWRRSKHRHGQATPRDPGPDCILLCH